MAARNGRTEVLDKLWEWAKEVLNTHEVNNNLFLARDDEETPSCLMHYFVAMYRY